MGRRRVRKYPTPRDEYVYSPEAVSLSELAKRWKGEPGCGYGNLEKRCRLDGWVAERDKFWGGVRKRMAEQAQAEIADRMKDSIVEANERHMEQGQMLQTVGQTLVVKFASKREDGTTPMDDIRPGEGLRIAARASKDGVDIERKALGLADRVVQVQFAKETAAEFVEIVTKYVSDPDVLENIAKDVDGIVERHRVGLEEEMGEEAGILH